MKIEEEEGHEKYECLFCGEEFDSFDERQSHESLSACAGEGAGEYGYSESDWDQES